MILTQGPSFGLAALPEGPPAQAEEGFLPHVDGYVGDLHILSCQDQGDSDASDGEVWQEFVAEPELFRLW